MVVDIHTVMNVIVRALFTFPGLDDIDEEDVSGTANGARSSGRSHDPPLNHSAHPRHLQGMEWWFVTPATCLMLVVSFVVVAAVFKVRERCLTTPDVQEVNFDAGPTLRDL